MVHLGEVKGRRAILPDRKDVAMEVRFVIYGVVGKDGPYGGGFNCLPLSFDGKLFFRRRMAAVGPDASSDIIISAADGLIMSTVSVDNVWEVVAQQGRTWIAPEVFNEHTFGSTSVMP
ncbi:uncharacterized protein EI90DRAFT_3050102 [Cantharellus anzutake]|uniref:uncharacterized protein n=1 Tax=Cantharellus anzutake TaxID=1750568 RepID=UPI001904A2F0|nr:uncharacterized protein EI90DRAFT_3050102 [Cantharellus anzutake]KAF8334756.1 hypothetical protein EI90DRAFT_3050102 [Cantharellus anzutake]